MNIFWEDAFFNMQCVDRGENKTCHGPGGCPSWRWMDDERVYGYCGRGGTPKSKIKEPLKNPNNPHVRPYQP